MSGSSSVGSGVAESVDPYSTPLAEPRPAWIVPDSSWVERDRAREAEWRRGNMARRIVNMVVAVVGLILSLPLMLLIALAIKATSRGPVLYKQKRVGLDRRHRSADAGPADRRASDRGGDVFDMYKFRTMTHRPHCREEVWASVADPRITKVGRILRKYRLDELPQLWNVLRGDMNIVGPRPEQPRIFQELREQVHMYPLRQRVLPGITGWAQVNQSYDQALDDVKQKVRLDLEYIARSSAVEDIRIMAMTVPVIVLKRGAL